jgi:Fur family transcriptional regulator, iron response regulator
MTPNLDQEADRLRKAGLRPTRQRAVLSSLLFTDCMRHVTAEALHAEAEQAGEQVSLATVYNTLHQFTRAGMLRQVTVDGTRTYFDTNVAEHHHFYREEDGMLLDIESDHITVDGLPSPPDGCRVERVDVVVRLRKQ